MLNALAGKGTSYPSNSGPYDGEMEVVTPMTTMDVTCPPGCKEGDQVRIQSPAGQVIQVAVPPGVSAGQVFQAQVPAVQQLHQGMPVVQPMAVAQPIAPIAAVPAGAVASAPVEPIDYSSACMEKPKKHREPGWVVPPSVVVSGTCNDVVLDFEKGAFPAGQQRSMVSVPGDCSSITLKVPEAVVNVRDSAMEGTSGGNVKYLWWHPPEVGRAGGWGQKMMLRMAQNNTRQERANENENGPVDPNANEVELTGSVGFCSEIVVKYL